MTTLYKLTDAQHYTRRDCSNQTLWGENVTHSVYTEGNNLCSKDVIHAYTHPLLAALFNPIHASFSSPVLWEAEGYIVADDGLKVGVKSLTTKFIIELPIITTNQRIHFAILCAKKVYNNNSWNEWADAWLNGKDRSKSSAHAAYVYAAYVYAAKATAYAAYNAVTKAAEAAYVATQAAEAAYAVTKAAAAAVYAAHADTALVLILTAMTNEPV